MRAISKIVNAFRRQKKSVVFDQKVTRIPAMNERVRKMVFNDAPQASTKVANPPPSPVRPKVLREPYSVSPTIRKIEVRTSQAAAEPANFEPVPGIYKSASAADVTHVADLSKLPEARGLTKRTRGQVPFVDQNILPVKVSQSVLDAMFDELSTDAASPQAAVAIASTATDATDSVSEQEKRDYETLLDRIKGRIEEADIPTEHEQQERDAMMARIQARIDAKTKSVQA